MKNRSKSNLTGFFLSFNKTEINNNNWHTVMESMSSSWSHTTKRWDRWTRSRKQARHIHSLSRLWQYWKPLFWSESTFSKALLSGSDFHFGRRQHWMAISQFIVNVFFLKHSCASARGIHSQPIFHFQNTWRGCWELLKWAKRSC